MKPRTIATAIAGLAIAAAGVAITTPATAAVHTTATTSCGTNVRNIRNHPDSGNHGTWANDTFTRTTVICTTATADTYHATVTDDGTFITVAGLSPNAGKPLAAGINGGVHGTFTADFTTTAPLNLATLGAILVPLDTPTDTWVQTLVGTVWASGTSINNDWAWVYGRPATSGTCERWIDSATNGNGGLAADGDITGKTCLTATPAPTPTRGHLSPSPVPPHRGTLPPHTTAATHTTAAATVTTPTATPSSTPTPAYVAQAAPTATIANAADTTTGNGTPVIGWVGITIAILAVIVLAAVLIRRRHTTARG